MATESGFSNQKKIGKAQFKTVHNLGSDRFGTSVTPKSLYEITALAQPIVNADLDSDSPEYAWIEITGHGARDGDVLRIISGNLIAWEFEIVEVLDVDTFKIILPTEDAEIPQIADTAKVMRWVTNKTDSEGNVNFQPGPTTFVQDNTTVTVAQDTANPANNKPLPAGLYFVKDGAIVPVTKDTVNSNNTAPLPVELHAVDGTQINITAGDLNVQLTDLGLNFDATRIGDGSGVYLAVNADGSINTVDADAVAALQSLDGKTPDLVAGKVPVDTGHAQPLTDAELRATPVPVSGALTDAELRAAPVPVDNGHDQPLTNAELRASAVPVSGPLTNTELRAASLTVDTTQLPASLGQKNAANSLSVVLAAGTTMDVSLAGSATEAKQDTQITHQVSALSKQDALKAVVGAVNDPNVFTPSSDGTVVSILKGIRYWLYTLDVRMQTLEADAAPLVGSYDENLSFDDTAAITLVKPSGAKWCKVLNLGDNNLRIKIGATATKTSGFRMEPGRSEDFSGMGDISVITESGAGAVCVQWGA